MFNPDPAQELPDDQLPITVPIGTPNQLGGVAIGAPSDPDPATTAALAAQRMNDQRLWLATHNANTGAPVPYHFNAPAPAPAPGPGPVPLLAPQAPPMAPGAPAPMLPQVPPAQAPRAPGVPGAGSTALPQGSADLQKQIQQGTQAQGEALDNLKQAQGEAADATADAYTDRANTRKDQAADMAAQQLYVRERQQKLDAEDTANLQKARDYVIPEFFESRQGALAGAALTAGLSGAAAALLGSTDNPALKSIQHNVDSYYQRQQEQVMNLYKYAETQGKVNDHTRQQLGETLTDLAQQHAYTLQAMADRIDAVSAHYKGRIDQANADYMKSQLQTQAAHELQLVRGLDVQLYDSKTKRIEANAAATRASAEVTKAKADMSDKADEAAFRTYVNPTYGKAAQTIKLRLDALDSALSGINEAKSVGEVNAQLDKAISADAGQGTRGVSIGQLHTIVPNLVSASGEISNKVSQGWDGKAGQEYRTAVKRMITSIKQARESEYKNSAEAAEKGLTAVPYAQKNPNFPKMARGLLFPERASLPEATQPQQQIPVGAKAKSNGKDIVMTANGWQYAQ